MARSKLYTVSRARGAIEAILPIFDILLACAALCVAPVVWLAARIGWRAPLTRKVFDSFSIAVLRHHYYTPVVFPGDLAVGLDSPRQLPGIDLKEEAQVRLLEALDFAAEASEALAGFDFDNPNFVRIDGFVLYAMLRHFKPKRMIEIGSGYSTRIAACALAQNPGPCAHSCIEPFEMPWLEELDVEVIRDRVEKIPLAMFETLEAGDVLFIDSSHAIRPQGDVVRIYLQILPLLAPGVIIHVHDVYTPHDLHPYLVLEQRKLWNEQFLMEALLSGGDRFSVLLANYWIGRQHPELFAKVVPGYRLPPERDGCSFWMRRD